MMLGVFWLALLKDIEIWKAYGVSAIIYFLATLDITFLGRDGLNFFDLSEVGPPVDLTLSFIAVVASEAWEALEVLVPRKFSSSKASF